MAEIILARMVGRQQADPCETQRVCNKCPEKGPQPIANFAKGKGYGSGRRKTCKACVTKARKAMEAERKMFDPF